MINKDTAGEKILKSPGQKTREIIKNKLHFWQFLNFFLVQKLIFDQF